MGLTKYLVSTTMGETLLDPSAETYVHITQNRFLEKSATDLNQGDMVLFSKPYATTSIDDVDPYLIRSPRYSKAKETVHEVNSEGRYIPKLRTMLMRGLADHGVIGGEDLESKILMEENRDFSREEYKKMTNHIYNLLNEDPRYSISQDGVRNWVEGRVLFPRNWDLLDILSETLNPEFSSFGYGDADQKSMYFNYRLYVTVRQGVMRFLNQARGITPGEKGEEGEAIISLSPEYQIIFEHFMKDLGANYATARITGIDEIREEEHIKELKKRNKNLEEGIVRKSFQFGFQQKTYPELFEDTATLTHYLSAIIECFDSNKIDLGRFDRYALVPGAEPFLLEIFGEGLDEHMLFVKRMSKGDRFESFGYNIKESILTGEMDSFFEFSHGTAMRLIESHHRTRRAIPQKIHEFYAQLIENTIKFGDQDRPISRKIRRDLIRKNEKLRKKYSFNHNEKGSQISGRILFSSYVANMIVPNHNELSESPLMVTERLSKEKRLSASLEPSLLDKIDNNLSFFTRENVLNILNQYELAEIIDLRKQDFYFEEI